jgi:hypothetical protein
MTLETSKWQVEKTADGEIIKWLPLLTLTFDFAHKRIIGIADNGNWTSQWFNGSIEIINSRDKCFNILVCLEKNRIDFENLLKEAIQNHNLDPELLNTFPTIELIKFSLQSHTSWTTNAVFWLTERDMDNELEELITKFTKDKYFSQQSRHYAFRILKNWQNNKPESNASC